MRVLFARKPFAPETGAKIQFRRAVECVFAVDLDLDRAVQGRRFGLNRV